jgi:molybdopterin/thiamine biosynthesis adenylyltransferase
MQYVVRICGLHFEEVRRHLYPGDNKEAIALALCGRFNNGRVTMLLVHKLLLIPYDECHRENDFIEWPTERAVPFLTEAMNNGLAIVKIHSHPGWYDSFSEVDDVSDHDFYSSVYGWTNEDHPHASLVMLPDGSLFGRIVLSDLTFAALDKISVAGDEIISWPKPPLMNIDEFGKRTAQLFGDATYEAFRNLKIGVVGCSGTGSITIEQLNRTSAGHLVLVDDKILANKNLNRILYSTLRDVLKKLSKVELFERVIREIGLGTKVTIFKSNLYDDPQALLELATCDIIIGCMDTAEGRHILNRLCSYYLVPYLDMGVSIDSDGKGGINKIEGSIHYIQPGKSSLLTRGVYSLEQVKAENLYRTNRSEYDRLYQASKKTGHKYIEDVNVDRPAVISINMQIASIAINELLNRIHFYKIGRIDETAKIAVDITANFMVPEPETDFRVDKYLLGKVGRGDCSQLLNMIGALYKLAQA